MAKSSIDLIKKIHVSIKEINKAEKDYDVSTNELLSMFKNVQLLIDELNSYSFERCKTFYTHYHLIESRKGYTLGADLREKSE